MGSNVAKYLPTMISGNTFRNQILLVIGLVFVTLVQAQLFVCQNCEAVVEVSADRVRRMVHSQYGCFSHTTIVNGDECRGILEYYSPERHAHLGRLPEKYY